MSYKLTTFAGTALIPTLARLVLGIAFIYAGSAKLFKSQQFTGVDAAELETLGIRLPEVRLSIAAERLLEGGRFVLSSFEQDSPQENATGGPPVASDDTGLTMDGAVFEGAQVNGLILLLHRQGMQYPRLMGWLAAVTEFVGGILILVGLFSRVWGLALATIMVVAVHMTTWQPLVEGKLFGMDPMLFGVLTTQLSLFVLAFGVMLTGGGPLSLDRVLFGRKPVHVARKPMLEHPVLEQDRTDIPMT